MLGGVNVWRIAKLKVIGKIKFGEWIDFGHKDTIYQLKFGWLKFGEPYRRLAKFTKLSRRQAFPLCGTSWNLCRLSFADTLV